MQSARAPLLCTSVIGEVHGERLGKSATSKDATIRFDLYGRQPTENSGVRRPHHPEPVTPATTEVGMRQRESPDAGCSGEVNCGADNSGVRRPHHPQPVTSATTEVGIRQRVARRRTFGGG
jgi:hypothetical protein